MKIRKDHKAVEVNLKSRRMFLKSASGLTLSIPLLPSMLTLAAENAVAQVANPPQRYVGIVNPFGGLQDRNWLGTNLPTTNLPLYPGHDGKIGQLSSLVGANGLSPVLDASFQNLWSYSNVIAGADQPHYFGHNKSAAFGAFAPATPGYQTLSDQFSFDGNGGLAGNIPSVDHVFANAGGNGIYGTNIGSRKRIVNIGAGPISFGRNDYFDLTNPVVNQDRINSTAGVFTYLFGSVNPQPSGQSSNPLIALINEFWPSGKSIYRFLSPNDRRSLDQLFDLAQQTATQYSFPIPACSKTISGTLSTNGWDTSKASELNLMAEIIALAFKCDITRIVNVAMSGATPQGTDWHAISHASSPADPNAGQDDSVIIHKMFSQNFVSKLGQNLLATDPFDSSSTILKNSMVVWSHENKVQHHNYNQPYFMMGSAGGRLKTGLMVDLRNKATAPVFTDYVGDIQYKGDIINRMWATMLHGMRIPKSQYEIQRGGTNLAVSLNKGYGHVIRQDSGYYTKVNHNLSKIGDAWEFMINT